MSSDDPELQFLRDRLAEAESQATHWFEKARRLRKAIEGYEASVEPHTAALARGSGEQSPLPWGPTPVPVGASPETSDGTVMMTARPFQPPYTVVLPSLARHFRVAREPLLDRVLALIPKDGREIQSREIVAKAAELGITREQAFAAISVLFRRKKVISRPRKGVYRRTRVPRPLPPDDAETEDAAE
jgi:hypothetical protein